MNPRRVQVAISIGPDRVWAWRTLWRRRSGWCPQFRRKIWPPTASCNSNSSRPVLPWANEINTIHGCFPVANYWPAGSDQFYWLRRAGGGGEGEVRRVFSDRRSDTAGTDCQSGNRCRLGAGQWCAFSRVRAAPTRSAWTDASPSSPAPTRVSARRRLASSVAEVIAQSALIHLSLRTPHPLVLCRLSPLCRIVPRSSPTTAPYAARGLDLRPPLTIHFLIDWMPLYSRSGAALFRVHLRPFQETQP